MICENCNIEMNEVKTVYHASRNGKSYEFKNVTVHECENCNNRVMEGEEVKRIEDLMDRLDKLTNTRNKSNKT